MGTEWADPDPKHNRDTRVPWDTCNTVCRESLGTPISDATEERHWRKLLHRGTFVRNRQSDKSKPTVYPNLIGCHKEESIAPHGSCVSNHPDPVPPAALHDEGTKKIESQLAGGGDIEDEVEWIDPGTKQIDDTVDLGKYRGRS